MTRQGINVFSAFDGMSCGQLALQRAGIKVNKYYASEVDKYAIAVTQHNFPNTIQMGDITELRTSDFPEKIDLMIGGSPCQGFSFAGKVNIREREQKGSCITSSYAAPDISDNFVRINNNTLKTHKQQDKARCLTVCGKSAGTNRDMNLIKHSKLIQLNSDVESVIQQQNRFYHRGGASPTLTAHSAFNVKIETDLKDIRKLTPRECERLQTVPDDYTSVVSNSQRYKMLGNGWTVGVIAYFFSFLPYNLI